jgi:hypothetical protein
VHQAPRFAGLARRAFLQQEIRILEHLFPQVLLLRRREQQRELFAQIAIKRVFPKALDERAEGQDVGRFPDLEVLGDLKIVEFRHQRLRQALVGRDHGHAGGVALSEAREEVGFGKHRGLAS